MSKAWIQKLAAIAVLGGGLGLALPGAAQASQVDLRPDWAGYLTHRDQNRSYLQDLDRNPRFARILEIQDWLIDPEMALRIQDQYRSMIRDYELRETYDLTSMEEERAHFERMSKFTEDVAIQVKNKHVNENLDKARKSASKLRETAFVKKIEKPVGAVVAVAATSIGQPISFRLTENTRFTARTHLWNQYGEFDLKSDWLNGSMLVGPRRHSNLPKLFSPLEKESYLVSVSRGIPLVDVSTGLSYGGTSTNLTASVGKSLTEHLSCSFDSSRPMNPHLSNTPQGEEVLRFLYSITF